MLKKLPNGIQTFQKIIKDDYVYVDKTKIAYHLINNGSYYFLSRPRRFGKSLFVDTLKEIFEGNKKLFQGLYIEDKWDWEKSFPVLKIDLTIGEYNSVENINESIRYLLNKQVRFYQLKMIKTQLVSQLFTEVVNAMKTKFQQPVVILIDEYDKPILDNISDPEMALKARNILRNFYGAIKGMDNDLRFVFITGVSKFSKTNLFSQLNNLEDITIDEQYSNITGYTDRDLNEQFSLYFKNANMEQVKRWYNGYNYFGPKVYNPYDILLFLKKGLVFKNYWWETGSPKFLIDMLRQGDYYIPDLENCIVGEETLNTMEVENINLIALLWQTGYLTFKEKQTNPVTGEIIYQMCVPNLEIQLSLNQLFKTFLTNIKYEDKPTVQAAQNQILKRDFENLKISLSSLFASIPYNNYANNIISRYEGYYSSVMYTFFAALGFDLIPEDVTNRGRIDITLKTPDSYLIFEFKADSKEPPIQQIKDRKYYEKYQSKGKDIYLIGILFDSEKRNITDFNWETV